MPPAVQPSIVIRSMWDNIVSWMKNAVDFVNFNDAGEVEAVDQLSPFGRVCPFLKCNRFSTVVIFCTGKYVHMSLIFRCLLTGVALRP